MTLGNIEKYRTMPLFVQSLAYWRHKLGKDLRHDRRKPCIYCGGFGSYKTKYGDVRCVCQLLHSGVVNLFTEWNERFASPMEERNLDDFDEDWPDILDHKTKLADLKVYVEDFVRWPDQWLTISGKVGTGKTFMLQWIAQQYGIYALYITEERYKESMFVGATESNAYITDLLKAMKRIPVLCFDDLGSGYLEKSNYTGDNLRMVFAYRYEMRKACPTVISTNMKNLLVFDERLGDRLMDKRFNFVDLKGVETWRRNDS